MADQVRSLVMVENEAYELIDGDGNFYVSKTNLAPAVVASSGFAFPGRETAFNDSVVPPQSNMEPILIEDYAKMNFFTQAASNVTIYLNSDNGGNFIAEPSSNEVIDLTTSSSTLEAKPKRPENDEPEFIDISKLKLQVEVKRESPEVTEMTEGDEENDVVFVKAYKIDKDDEDDDDDDFLPLDLRNRPEEKKDFVQEPRRNPKRTVQIFKEYYNSFKYNPDAYAKGKRKLAEFNEQRKKLGAIFNQSSLLTNEHFKEWPADGMHEKPTYNASSGKLEKFDGIKKKPSPGKKIREPPAKRVFKRGKRRTGKVKGKDDDEEDPSKEFATLTHETLQDVIGYVNQLREYNKIMKQDRDDENRIMSGAADILIDSCVLYSIANDVPQKFVSKYLKTIRKDLKL